MATVFGALACGSLVGCSAPTGEDSSSDDALSGKELPDDLVRTCTGVINADKRDPFIPTETLKAIPLAKDLAATPVTIKLLAHKKAPSSWYQANSKVALVSRNFEFNWNTSESNKLTSGEKAHFGGRYDGNEFAGLHYRGIEISIANDDSVTVLTTYYNGRAGSLSDADRVPQLASRVKLTCN